MTELLIDVGVGGSAAWPSNGRAPCAILLDLTGVARSHETKRGW